MGSPAEFHSPAVFDGGTMNGYNNGRSHGSQTKATFSGVTALASVAALIISIISTAVPNWGYYTPRAYGLRTGSIQGGFSNYDNNGNFGPFQICFGQGISYCGGRGSGGGFHTQAWIKVAGACSLLVVFSLAGLAFFSILHVAMQLQRRHILVSFQRAVFFKVVFAAIAALGSILACIFGGIEFFVNAREGQWDISIGVCYYLQIVLIFVNIFFIIVCYISYKKAKTQPPPMVPISRQQQSYDDRHPNGVAMTAESQYPYRHGQPIQPIRPQQTTYQQYQPYQQYNNNIPQLPPTFNGSVGYTLNDTPPVFQRPQPGPQQPPTQLRGQSNNGFTSVSLVVPPHTSPTQIAAPVVSSAAAPIRSVPLIHTAQPLKPIQPVQPQMQSRVQVLPSPTNNGGHVVGVSFTPAGRHSAVQNPGGAGHGGSMESLNSTLSSTLSFGSTTSTGSGVSKELRSSLKKSKNKDAASVSSRSSSSKQVRISLGQEQTQV